MNTIHTQSMRFQSAPILEKTDLFSKFCPSTEDVLTVDFEDMQMTLDYPIDDRRGKETQHHMVWETKSPLQKLTFLKELIDPQGKITHLIDQSSISRYIGNATVDKAQIILLDDNRHGDAAQALIRGEITNSVKGKKNTLLFEGCGNETMYFNEAIISQIFGPNLDWDLKKSFMAGWDDEIEHKKGLENIRHVFQDYNLRKDKINSTLNKMIDLVNDLEISELKQDNIQNILDKLDPDFKQLSNIDASFSKTYQCFEKGSHNRTINEWKTIQKFHSFYPEDKIIVFAGAGHNHEPWMLEQLKMSGLKYCILTPVYTKLSPKETVENAKKYYGANKNIFRV